MSQVFIASLRKYLLFRIICFLLTIQQSNTSTIIYGTWYDDFASDISQLNGWKIHNFVSLNESKYFPPDSNPIVLGGNGKQYHGPVTKRLTATRSIYYQRRFICSSGGINNLNRIYLQYSFAFCKADVFDNSRVCEINSEIEVNELGNDICSLTSHMAQNMDYTNDSYPMTDNTFVSNALGKTGCRVNDWRFKNLTTEMTENNNLQRRNRDFSITLKQTLNNNEYAVLYDFSLTCVPTNDTRNPSIQPTMNPTVMPTTSNPTAATANPTAHPTTNNPTTNNPTTNNPTTNNPTTNNPTTNNPTTNNPTINPTTIIPTTSAPTTTNPTTILPTTSDPTTSNPTTNNPSIAPTTAIPTTVNPTTANPTTTTMIPTTNMPTTSIPTTSNPTTLNPTTSNPSMNPTTNVPSTAVPSTAVPSTVNPTTVNPTTSMPTTHMPTINPSMNPTTDVPTTAIPTTSGPTTTNPTTITSTSQPSVTPSNIPTDYPSTYNPTAHPITYVPTRSPTRSPTSNPTTNSPTTHTPTTHPITDPPVSNNAVIFIEQVPKDYTIISHPFDRFVVMNKFYVKSKYNVDADCFKCFQWTINNTLINDLYDDNSEYVTFYNIKIDTVILTNGIEYDIFESYLIIHSVNYGHTNPNNNKLYCSQHSDDSEIIKNHLLQYGNDYNLRFEVCYNGVKNIGSNMLKIVTNRPPFGGYCQIDNLDNLHLLGVFNLECFNWTSQSNENITYNAILSNGVLVANEFVPISEKIYSIVSIGDLEIKILIKDSFDSVTCYDINVSFPSFTQIVEESGNMTESINVYVDSMSNILLDTNLGENNNIASALYSVIDGIVTSHSSNTTLELAPFQQLTEDMVENLLVSSPLNLNNTNNTNDKYNVTADAISSELSVLTEITSNPLLVTEETVAVFIDEYFPLMFEGFNTYIDGNSGRRRRRRRLLTTDEEDTPTIANQLEVLVNKLQMLLMNIEAAVSGDDIIDTNTQSDMLIEYALNGIHVALSDSFPGEEYYNQISNIASNMSKIFNGVKFDNTDTKTNKTLTCGLLTENIIIPIAFTSENRGSFDCSFIKSTVNNFIPSDEMTITNSSYKPASNVIAINLYSEDSDLEPIESETDACDPFLISIDVTDTSLLESFLDFDFELDETVTFPTCNFWDISSSTWSDYGCWVYNVSVEDNRVTCSCVHLSTFQVSAGDFIPKANLLSLWHFRNFTISNLLKYPTVSITMLSLFMIIVCMCIVSTLNEKDNTAILAFEDIIFRKVRDEKLRTSEIGREIDVMAKYLPNADKLGSGIFQLAKGKNAKKSICQLTTKLYRIHLFNNHTLLSIFVKAEGTNFSSKQRLGCFLMYLCTVIVSSAMVYGVDQNNIIGDISASFWISIFGTLPVMFTKQIFLNSKPKIVPRTMHLANKDKESEVRKSFKLRRYKNALDLAREARLHRTVSTKIKMVNSVRLSLFDEMYPLHQNWKICAWVFLIVWTVCVSFAALQFGLEFDIKFQKLRNTNNEQLNMFDNDCWQNNQELLIEDKLSNLHFNDLQNKLDQENDFGDNYDFLFAKVKSESTRWIISCFQSILLSIFWWQPVTIYFVTWIGILAFSWNLQMSLGPKTIIGLVKRCCCCSHSTEEDSLKECLTPEREEDYLQTHKYIRSNSSYSVFAHQNRPLDLIGYISNDQLFTDIEDKGKQQTDQQAEESDSFSLSLSISEEEIKENTIHSHLPPKRSHLEMIPTQSQDTIQSLSMNEVEEMKYKTHCNIKFRHIQEKDNVATSKHNLNRIDTRMINEVMDDADFFENRVSFAPKMGKSSRKTARVTFAMTEEQVAKILDQEQNQDDIEFTKNRNPIVVRPISFLPKKIGHAPRETVATMTEQQLTQILDNQQDSIDLYKNINSKDLSPIAIAKKVGHAPRETVATMTENQLKKILDNQQDSIDLGKNINSKDLSPIAIAKKVGNTPRETIAMSEHVLAEILDNQQDSIDLDKNINSKDLSPISFAKTIGHAPRETVATMTDDQLTQILDDESDSIHLDKNINSKDLSPISIAKKVGHAPPETVATMTEDQLTQILDNESDSIHLDKNINSNVSSAISIAQKVGNTPRETIVMTEHVLAEILVQDPDINNVSKNRTPPIVTPVSIENRATLKMTDDVLAEILHAQAENLANKEPEISNDSAKHAAIFSDISNLEEILDIAQMID